MWVGNMLKQGECSLQPCPLARSPKGDLEIHSRHKRGLWRVHMLHRRVNLLLHLAKLIRAAAAAIAACLLLLLLRCCRRGLGRRGSSSGIAVVSLCCRPLLPLFPLEVSPKLPVPKVGWQAPLGQQLNGTGDAIIQVCRQGKAGQRRTGQGRQGGASRQSKLGRVLADRQGTKPCRCSRHLGRACMHTNRGHPPLHTCQTRFQIPPT